MAFYACGFKSADGKTFGNIIKADLGRDREEAFEASLGERAGNAIRSLTEEWVELEREAVRAAAERRAARYELTVEYIKDATASEAEEARRKGWPMLNLDDIG